ncbi:MAG TPA: MBOAT family protein [Roseomonas sp.]|jgi:D-alanyl-lipoteichoic acid acyltransferase DltB (MBOAT superfamily)
MLFPTGAFALFFAVVFVVHWGLVRHGPGLVRWFLLAANLAFYSFWSPRLCLGLVALGLGCWFIGLKLGDARASRRRSWLTLGVGLTLLWLGYFKYANFFLQEIVGRLDGVFGMAPPPLLDVVLPVGISFYCFQAISYMIDVHRGDARTETGPGGALNVLVYLTFFPHLAAGPIVRAAHFLPQVAARPDPGRIPVVMAGILILGGLFKKVIIANELGTGIVDPVFRDPTAYGAAEILLACYGYSVQIWCDFSAYSDMAIGIAALLGYHFPKNFNQPFRALSLSEFWGRWHISLSRWLRDYLYIPLGGNRGSEARTARNLFLTMLLGGIWHGAAWTFVLWGGLHGAALILERWLGGKTRVRRQDARMAVPAGAPDVPGHGAGRLLRWVITFHVVVLLFVLFRASDLATVRAMANGLMGRAPGADQMTPRLVLLCALGLGLHFLPPDFRERLEAALRPWPPLALGLLAGLVLLLILLAGPEGVAPFIYFQF